MKLSIDVTLPFARELVYTTYRDQMTAMVDYLPSIRSIEVVERSELEGGAVAFVNEWVGGGDIPAVARAFVSHDMLRWTDYATWRDFTVDWRTQIHVFPGAIECAGRHHYHEDGNGTRLELRGELTCDASKVPAVPRLLVKKVSGAVEQFLGGQIQSNFESIARGVGRYLQERGG